MRPYNQDLCFNPEAVPAAGSAPELSLDAAIKRSQEFLLSMQYAEGYWWAELESNVAITAEAVLFYKVLQIDDSYPLKKVEKYIRERQRDNGSWELYYGDGGELSVTIETYLALRLMNVPTSDPALERAREFILQRGGISKARVFTQLHLALIGCYDWGGIPSLPIWVMLLPNWFLTTIYEMSSWARSCTVPLMIVFDRKPVFSTNPAISLDELYVEGRKHAKLVPAFRGDWTDAFIALDFAFKLAEKLKLMPFRHTALKAAEKWVIERQEETGDWAGIFPAMSYSLLSLLLLGYSVSDPIFHRGLEALRAFSIETEDEYCVQSCISPVWDTALVMRSLVDSGLPPDHPALQRAGNWLLRKQILQKGDWAVKNKGGRAGGWAFEFQNRWYPDVDDTAVVVMALKAVQLPNEALKQQAIVRAVEWINSMQCKAGGWGAFDKDNDQNWLNATPYGDLKAMIDPNTSDVTARVVEMMGRLRDDGFVPSPMRVNCALAFLRKEQEKEGCWFGRWGANYIYGTSGVLIALSLMAPGSSHEEEIWRGARWLVESQRKNKAADGGWAESCESYKDPSLKGEGEGSTASQTAWALQGLMAAGEAVGKFEVDVIASGVKYLLNTQRVDGSWHEKYFTGTGFPCHFYLKYHFYAQHFPLSALGRYRALLQGKRMLPTANTSPNNI